MHHQEIRAPVAERENEPEPEYHGEPVDAHRVGSGSAQQRFPRAGPGISRISFGAQAQCGRVLGDGLKRAIHPAPTANIFQSKINDRRKTEHNHEELEHLRVDGRSQSAFEHIYQHNSRTNPESGMIIPTEQLVEQLGQSVHGNTGSEHRHHGEGDRVERADAFVKAHLQVFRDGAGFGSVVEWHHENSQKDHRWNRADPIEVAGRDAVLGAAGSHSY